MIQMFVVLFGSKIVHVNAWIMNNCTYFRNDLLRTKDLLSNRENPSFNGPVTKLFPDIISIHTHREERIQP